VDSDGVTLMDLALNGFKSCDKAEVHCRSGSRFYDGADCHVTPDECVPDIEKLVKGVRCLIWHQIAKLPPATTTTTSTSHPTLWTALFVCLCVCALKADPR